MCGSKCRMKEGNEGRGFTLIELLVVVVILGVLLAILLPALSRSRARGRDVVCGANLKGIGIGLLAYQSDRGDLPVAAFIPPPFDLSAAHLTGPLLTVTLDGYVEVRSKVYRCPTDFDQVWEPVAKASGSGAGISYCYWEGGNRLANKLYGMNGDRRRELMRDFQGYGLQADNKKVEISPQLHPGPKATQGGQNKLFSDGSVVFRPGSANDVDD